MHKPQWEANTRDLASLQRQIDKIKKQQGDTITVRDALMEMKDRLEKAEGATYRRSFQ